MTHLALLDRIILAIVGFILALAVAAAAAGDAALSIGIVGVAIACVWLAWVGEGIG